MRRRKLVREFLKEHNEDLDKYLELRKWPREIFFRTFAEWWLQKYPEFKRPQVQRVVVHQNWTYHGTLPSSLPRRKSNGRNQGDEGLERIDHQRYVDLQLVRVHYPPGISRLSSLCTHVLTLPPLARRVGRRSPQHKNSKNKKRVYPDSNWGDRNFQLFPESES
jgi:hypothetical protein